MSPLYDEAVAETVLVSVAELGRIIEELRPTLLDVRYRLGGVDGREEYLRGHLPGASYVDLETELAAPPGPRGRHPLPEPDRFQDAMRRRGVSTGRPVVVYDAVAGASAARCWWLLRYFGHRDVRVLDGGYPRWAAEGGPVATGEVETERGDFTARPGQMPVLDADGAARVARTGVLVDARAAERFRGDVEPIDPVAGHIPGAVNLPYPQNLEPGAGPAARFRSRDELAALYGTVGVEPGTDREVGVYCGSGVTAVHDVLALARIGVPAALYPGSWSEWVTDPQRPVGCTSSPD